MEIIITICDRSIINVDTPEDCLVIVRDYDEAETCRKEGTQPIGKIKADESGDEYVESIWPVTNIIDEEYQSNERPPHPLDLAFWTIESNPKFEEADFIQSTREYLERNPPFKP